MQRISVWRRQTKPNTTSQMGILDSPGQSLRYTKPEISSIINDVHNGGYMTMTLYCLPITIDTTGKTARINSVAKQAPVGSTQ